MNLPTPTYHRTTILTKGPTGMGGEGKGKGGRRGRGRVRVGMRVEV